ncbi:hypothetical protein B6N31_18220 [Dickeya fangzhongdai]|nr:hypothetical protein B6N31_18220 [Dickeya fangzhongdai]
MPVRWLPSLTPVTYLCKLLGIHSVAAFQQLELFWVAPSYFKLLEVAGALALLLRVYSTALMRYANLHE